MAKAIRITANHSANGESLGSTVLVMAELAALAAPQPEVRLLPVDDNTLTRLHALACFYCGSTSDPLLPAGHVYTDGDGGGRYGWPVVACPRHVVAEHVPTDRP